LAIVKSSEWNIQGFNGLPLYLLLAATRSGWNLKSTFGVAYSHFFYFFVDGRASMYYDEQDLENICQGYYNKFTALPQLENLINDHRLHYNEIADKVTYRSRDLPNLSAEQLVVLMGRLCDRITEAVGSAHGIEGITFGSEKKLRKLLTGEGKEINENDFGMVCAPTVPSFLSEAQRALWAIKNLSDSERLAAIDLFIKDFGWIENSYLGTKHFSTADVIDRAEQLKEEPRSNSTEHIRKQKDAILAEFDLTARERFIITTIEQCFHWQDNRKKYILQSIEVLEPVVQAVADRFNIDVSDLKFITPDELDSQRLAGSHFQTELRQRREHSVYYATPDETYIFTGSDYDFFAQELKVETDGLGHDLQGVVASPGNVRGVVKICESVSEIDKIQTGEILVASMTRPEYLPAMQKAAAIVTDEGGITSHAAIVSRELGKPCVIGTKYATRVLKDGDKVEVDADHGVVRKL